MSSITAASTRTHRFGTSDNGIGSRIFPTQLCQSGVIAHLIERQTRLMADRC